MDPKLKAKLIEAFRLEGLLKSGGGGPRNSYYERGKRVVQLWQPQHPRTSYEDCIRTLADYLRI